MCVEMSLKSRGERHQGQETNRQPEAPKGQMSHSVTQCLPAYVGERFDANKSLEKLVHFRAH